MYIYSKWRVSPVTSCPLPATDFGKAVHMILLGSDELHKQMSFPFLKAESNCYVVNKVSLFLVHIWSLAAASHVSLQLLEEHSHAARILAWCGA